MVEVRELKPEEFEQAGRITAQAFREFAEREFPDNLEEWREHFSRTEAVADRANRVTVLGAFVNGELAGTVSLELDDRVNREGRRLEPDEAHIRMLGVDSKFQGQGAGRALMTRCLELAKAAGKREITLSTNPRMLAAQHIYSSLGFVEVGEGEWREYQKYRLDLVERGGYA
jgi:ribosomal protein S18 acetylase RimI-like enzyme